VPASCEVLVPVGARIHLDGWPASPFVRTASQKCSRDRLQASARAVIPVFGHRTASINGIDNGEGRTGSEAGNGYPRARRRNGVAVARITNSKDMDAIGPVGWRKLVPFAPVLTSDRLGWIGLEAARFRTSASAELYHPPLTLPEVLPSAASSWLPLEPQARAPRVLRSAA